VVFLQVGFHGVDYGGGPFNDQRFETVLLV
jgi:hypothetical protein